MLEGGMPDSDSLETQDSSSGSGGFLALALIAATAGAAAAILLTPERGLHGRKAERKRRRDQGSIAAAGFLVGAGLTALLTPESGWETRRILSSTLGRMKVGAIDHIERLRLTKVPSTPEEPPVRSVQELGRDPDNVF
jgi:gas vesicle protein